MKNKSILLAAVLLVAIAGSAFAQQSIYIPLISKGFQHQFWQAVKAGAEEAATRNGVSITFEGPNTEAEIDKQTDILNAAIAKNPQGLGFAALDSQAQIPALQAAGVRARRPDAAAARLGHAAAGLRAAARRGGAPPRRGRRGR